MTCPGILCALPSLLKSGLGIRQVGGENLRLFQLDDNTFLVQQPVCLLSHHAGLPQTLINIPAVT